MVENFTDIDIDDLYDDLYTLAQDDNGMDVPQGQPASVPFRVTLGVIYIFIIVVCGLGDLLFLLVVGRYKKARTATNLLIANVALSDFVVAIFCIPFNLDYYVINDMAWKYGRNLCAMVNYVKMVSLHVSTNALVVIGVERYITIVRPRWRRVGRTGAMLVSVGVWTASILIAIPSAKFSMVRPYSHQSHSFCGVVWYTKHETIYKGFYGSMLVFQYVLPVVVMTFCSLTVVWKVFHRELPGIPTDMIRERVNRSKRKTLRLVAILAMFVLCWAPYYVYAALRDFHYVLVNTPFNTNIFYTVEAAAMGNSVINTCVYMVFNTNVINFVKILVKDCCGLPQTRESDVMLRYDGTRSLRQNFDDDPCQETAL